MAPSVSAAVSIQSFFSHACWPSELLDKGEWWSIWWYQINGLLEVCLSDTVPFRWTVCYTHSSSKWYWVKEIKSQQLINLIAVVRYQSLKCGFRSVRVHWTWLIKMLWVGGKQLHSFSSHSYLESFCHPCWPTELLDEDWVMEYCLISRDHFVYVPSQWEMMLQCNVASNSNGRIHKMVPGYQMMAWKKKVRWWLGAGTCISSWLEVYLLYNELHIILQYGCLIFHMLVIGYMGSIHDQLWSCTCLGT